MPTRLVLCSTALALALTSGAANGQTQAYLVTLDGREVGFATLALRPGAQAPTLRYDFHAELSLSGDPCLRSEERSSGTARASDPVLPEELFVALAPALGLGCRAVRGPAEPAARKASKVSGGADRGQGCWTQVSDSGADGTLFGAAVSVRFAGGGLPQSVSYAGLGVRYQATAAIPERLTRCARTPADDGVPAPGGKGLDARALRHVAYGGPGEQGLREARTPTLPLPEGAAAALAEVRAASPASCQEAATVLARALETRHHPARKVAGLLLDQGRFYPHAWVEVRVGDAWLPLDATTGSGWADAGRLALGSLGDFQGGLALLRALSSPPRILVHE